MFFVTHDESLFHANDGRRSGWGPEDEQPLHKKGQGRAIYVSEFLCKTLGRLNSLMSKVQLLVMTFPLKPGQ